jgi:hypothetical protein
MVAGMARSRAVAFAVTASLTVLAAPAVAAPRGYGLTVASAEPSCPDVAAVAASVRAVGAHEVTTSPGAPKFAVVFGRDKAGFTAIVSSPDGGVRELHASACADLLPAVATVIVLALDPITGMPQAPPPTPPAPAAQPAPSSESEEESVRIAIALRAWAMSGFGPVSPGVLADYEVVPTPWLTVGIGGGVLSRRSAKLGNGSIARGVRAGHAQACIYPYRRQVWVGGCFELVLGLRTLDPEGYEDAEQSGSALVAPATGLRVEVPLGVGLALDGEVGALLALPSYTFTAEQGKVVQESDLVSLSVRLGLRYTLP